MKKSVLKKYAHLIVKVGANVQKGQDVIVRANVDQELLVSMIVEDCYKAGANKVSIIWDSDKISKIEYKKASIKALSYIPDWRIEKEKYINKTLPCMIYIESSDPDALKGVNQQKVATIQRNIFPILKPFRIERDNKYQWVIAGAASKEWAKKVFPDLPTSKAVEKLWDAILLTSRCGEDPIKAWELHNKNLKEKTAYLNSLHLDHLHYTSKNGTDFKVWLLDNALWEAGGETTSQSKIFFNPNIPSEEIFTSPKKGVCEGILYSTKPLNTIGPRSLCSVK